MHRVLLIFFYVRDLGVGWGRLVVVAGLAPSVSSFPLNTLEQFISLYILTPQWRQLFVLVLRP